MAADGFGGLILANLDPRLTRRGLGLLGWYILTLLAVGIPLLLIVGCLISA